MEIAELFSQYSDERIAECRRISGGHINASFYIQGERGEYLLQKLNGKLFGKFTELLESSYLAYVRACDKQKESFGEWELPCWLRNREGGFFIEDDSGIWRMYEYIKGDTLQQPCSREQVQACGRGLARLHTILSVMEDVQPVLPGLHDLNAYYIEYLSAKENAEEMLRDKELEEIIDSGADAVLTTELPGSSMIHGDARIGNMVFRDGRVVAMIDLDTIMRGPRILDLADCIRSSCLTEGRPDTDKVKDFLQAYEKDVSPELSAEERELLPAALKRICFELGLRYYTDHLKGNLYFFQEYSGQNLEKARKLLVL